MAALGGLGDTGPAREDGGCLGRAPRAEPAGAPRGWGQRPPHRPPRERGQCSRDSLLSPRLGQGRHQMTRKIALGQRAGRSSKEDGDVQRRGSPLAGASPAELERIETPSEHG